MNAQKLYKETFAQVHTSVKVNLEDYQMGKQHPNYNYVRILAGAAAAAVLLMAMTATALAFNLFGLRDIAFPERTTLHVPVVDDDTGEVHYEDWVVDVVSMQGYADTPEAQACMEWATFYQEYTDAHSFGNDIYDEGGRYSCYSVYDDAMAAKLDEIAAKYDLKLHTELFDVEDRDAWLEFVGPTFLDDNNTAYWGYRYDDGTCSFEGGGELGAAELKGYGLLEYQFHYARKGYLDTVALNVGDLNNYAEWDYTTANGVAVKLALGTNRSFIWADLPEGFLFINILGGREGDSIFAPVPIAAAQVEELAELFDFTALNSADTRGDDISQIPPVGPEAS